VPPASASMKCGTLCALYLNLRELTSCGGMSDYDPDINHRIWQVVALIPRGTVATYGDVARQAGMAGAARRVGRALRCLPPDTRIPWHRVVGAPGKISLPENSASCVTQRERLQAEGVEIRASNRLDLGRYRWRP